MFYDEVNKNWLPWPAHAYNNQVNPQIVDETVISPSFTPPGTYRWKLETHSRIKLDQPGFDRGRSIGYTKYPLCQEH
jgi:hypothetical protein